ncbi:hypothetical protein [Alkalihalobacterium alkalinitrilicum]|uniref:hypothetical protein n=1 Tax=Alkalihalobacterium alkalinitrilicum TaxID=427920 RepID=UPI0009959834|nr:hypothetical protein [Alkalihalobacterium alkalinitrilicum]
MEQLDLDQLMKETHEYYQQRSEEMHLEVKQLKRANSKLKNEVRALKKVIYNFKQQEKQKQHYKNGRRGSKFNG